MIFYIEDPQFYSAYVIGLGIERFAEKLNMQCKKYLLSDTKLQPYEDDCILFLEGFQFRGASPIINRLNRDVNQIRKVLPKAKIVVFGSYSTHCNEYIEYDHPIKTDLHLDTSYNVTLALQEIGACADMYLWSGTEKVYNLAKNAIPHLRPGKIRDCICLCRCPHDAQPNGWFYDRVRLFHGLKSRGYPVAYNLEQFTLNDIFQEYMQSSIAIGTTTPSSDKERNGKGFRDWIAPFFDCVLIHDDYEGYIHLYDDIVPMFKYGDIDACVQKIEEVKAWTPEQRASVISKQIAFAEHNTLEKQLYRAYHKYITKQITCEPILQKP